MPSPPPIQVIPYRDDPLAALAAQLLARHQAQLPDLSQCSVILADTRHAPRLRQHLLQGAAGYGHHALLGPAIHSLAGWLSDQPLDIEQTLISPYAAELILIEALSAFPDLYQGANPWTLGEALLGLFNELSHAHLELPEDLASFTEQLARGYGIRGRHPASLLAEGKLVHTLWRAWQRQLAEEGHLDAAGIHLLKLAASLTQLRADEHLYLCGFQHLGRAECDWLRELLKRGQASLILHGDAERKPPLGSQPASPLMSLLQLLDMPPSSPAPALDPHADAFAACLDSVYGLGGATLDVRAKGFAREHPCSPLQGRLEVFNADGGEHEAQAIDLQIRRWLLQGRRRIGVITEDLRLARRLRALLERAGIDLEDASGWALSTTRAAAVLERWLQTLEEDFAQQPMLDLLKSPFMSDEPAREQHLATVFRLEQDIIQHENIGRGMARYRRHLNFRRRRLEHWPEQGFTLLLELLDRLDHAAAPVLALLRGEHPPAVYLDALEVSLQRLGLHARLLTDAAGAKVLQVLEELRAALDGRSLNMDWNGFRSWLARSLEGRYFKPLMKPSAVQLFSLEQSVLGRFDALILAGAERELLPGGAQASPFFNDAVRAELGLATQAEQQAIRFEQFRHALEAAPQVLVSVRREQDGEPIIPSPWLELLRRFHTLAYGNDLAELTLAPLLAHPDSQVFLADTRELPQPPAPPRPTVPPELLPERLSASSHQSLIDCPYQFFAAECLRLRPREEISEALQKSDFGERVHRCLEALHGDVPQLPGPWTSAFIPANRQAITDLLAEISRQVFAEDLEDNFQHRGWYRKWQAVIPDYVDWQIGRSEDWQPLAVEQRVETPLQHARRLVGRLDRVDRQRGLDPGEHGSGTPRLAIIDYKTGSAPGQAEVDSGEAVQLPSYALSQSGGQVEQVEYLLLDKQVKSGAILEGAQLAELSHAVAERLEHVLQDIAEGAALPAWGDEKTCGYCRMQGVCRYNATAELNGLQA